MPKRGIGLHNDLPGSPEQVEVVDVERALRNAQRGGCIFHSDRARVDLARIGLDLKLGHIGAEYGKKPEQTGLLINLWMFLGELGEVRVRLLMSPLSKS